MRLEGLDHVALFVRDLPRSVQWYRDVLGLERRYQEAWGDVPVVLAAGGSGVALFAAEGFDVHIPPNARSPRTFAHVAFRTSAAGLSDAMAALHARAIPFEEQDHGIARSIYLRDPDGHLVEVTTYDVGATRSVDVQATQARRRTATVYD